MPLGLLAFFGVVQVILVMIAVIISNRLEDREGIGFRGRIL